MKRENKEAEKNEWKEENKNERWMKIMNAEQRKWQRMIKS